MKTLLFFFILLAHGFAAELYIVGAEPIGDEAAIGSDWPQVTIQRAGDYSMFYSYGWNPQWTSAAWDFVPSQHITLPAGSYVFKRWDYVHGYTTATDIGGTPAWPAASAGAFEIRDDDTVYWTHYATMSAICIFRGSGTIPATVTVPIIGAVTLPATVATSPQAAVFFIGLSLGAGVMLFKATRRWFRRVGMDTNV